jgi:putative ABC transport system permease protein
LLGRKVNVMGVFAKEGNSIIGSSADNLVLIPYHFAKTIIDINIRNFNAKNATKS